MCEDRIQMLEQKLRESEKERHRYQNEANRIKEMMQRNVMSTRHAAQIGESQESIIKSRFCAYAFAQFYTYTQQLSNHNLHLKLSIQRNQSEPGNLES